MGNLNYIFWNVDPELFSIGPLTIRWYGLFFALSFLIGQQIIHRMYKTEGKDIKQVDPLTIYMVIATIVGARLGHCLFYDPYYYFIENPLELIKVWEGGLASHGAAFAIIFAAWRFAKKYKTSFLWVLDRVVIVIALAGCFIRSGNLMNSEIIGRPTNSSVGFVFARNIDHHYNYSDDHIYKITSENLNTDTLVDGQLYAKTKLTFHFDDQIALGDAQTYLKNDFPHNVRIRRGDRYLAVFDNEEITPEVRKTKAGLKGTLSMWAIPRHAAQLYEALSSLLAFVILMVVYFSNKGKIAEGRMFGIFCIVVFILRFLYEYLKENQSTFAQAFDNEPFLNMGQILSIPFIIFGLYTFIKSFKQKKNETVSS